MRIELGEIESAVPRWRRLLLFNSLPQFLSWAACIGLVIGVGGALIWWHDGDRAKFGLPLVCGLAGSLPAVGMARPSRLRVRGPGRAQAFAVLEERMLARGFAYAGIEAGAHRYRRKGPRWMRWNEQDVAMKMDGDMLLVTGPYAVLSLYRRSLRFLFDA